MKILVVDDESPILTLWQRFLERWGYQVDTAADGREALDLIRARTYHLVITDLAMPGVTGQELLRTAKSENPDLQFIVTTGYGTIEVAVETMKAGAFDFLTKPINFNYAELVIEKCLESVNAHQENLMLRQKNRDLEELNELKEKFIAITSHELRTPVGIISNIVELLTPELESHPGQSLFRLISRSSQQLNEIVGQMHELSHMNSAKLVLARAPFELHMLCREIMDELKFVLDKRKHRITMTFPEAMTITADRLKFKKVVRELLQNAIKFTEDGGEISIKAAIDEGNVLNFSVSDTGIGIPQENLDKIFHLFYEVGDSLHHHTSKEEFLGGGMGVGLSIVNDIVKAHDGTVEVVSEVNQGSRFIVHIPQDAAMGNA